MTEPISEILGSRTAKSEEVQRLFQKFHQAYSELMDMDRAINPRLAILTDALYGIPASTPSAQLNPTTDTQGDPPETGAGLVTQSGGDEVPGDLPPKFGGKRSRLEVVVLKILREEGRPLDTTELYKRVSSTGFNVGGQNPRGNMGAHLSHSKIFRNGLRGWEIVRKDGTVVNNG